MKIGTSRRSLCRDKNDAGAVLNDTQRQGHDQRGSTIRQGILSDVEYEIIRRACPTAQLSERCFQMARLVGKQHAVPVSTFSC